MDKNGGILFFIWELRLVEFEDPIPIFNKL